MSRFQRGDNLRAPRKSFSRRSAKTAKTSFGCRRRKRLVDKMLDMAKVTPKDYVIDLGSGDGRTVITAAKRGSKALGIEYNPDMVELSKQRPPKKASAIRRVSSKPIFSRAIFPRPR